jgi:hypothetical protein
MALEHVAARFGTAGYELADAGSALRRSDPGAEAFGGDSPGRFGELGRELHRICQAALDAREREARAHGLRLCGAADAVGRATAGYEAADDAARRRFGESRD